MTFNSLGVMSSGYAVDDDLTDSGDSVGGSLKVEQNTPGNLVVRYTTGTNFSTGTIYIWRGDTGAVDSQAVVNGMNTFTSYPTGIVLKLYVMTYNVNGNPGNISKPLFVTTAGGS